MRYLFSADFHLGHENIIKYCDRPFVDVRQMNNSIIDNCNSVVKEEDTVFHIGDFCLLKSKEAPNSEKSVADFISRMRGNYVFLQGNHDSNNGMKSRAIIRNCVVNYGGLNMFLVHNPEYANEYYPINLVGHVHEKWAVKILSNKSIAINVGVDIFKWRPVTIDSILNIYRMFQNGQLVGSNFEHRFITPGRAICVKKYVEQP